MQSFIYGNPNGVQEAFISSWGNSVSSSPQSRTQQELSQIVDRGALKCCLIHPHRAGDVSLFGEIALELPQEALEASRYLLLFWFVCCCWISAHFSHRLVAESIGEIRLEWWSQSVTQLKAEGGGQNPTQAKVNKISGFFNDGIRGISVSCASATFLLRVWNVPILKASAVELDWPQNRVGINDASGVFGFSRDHRYDQNIT